jgi:hypothetical protein
MSPILGALGGVKAYGFGAAASSNAFESIATVTIGSGGASSISFTSIPQTYKHLQIRGISKYNASNFWSTIVVNGVAMTNGGTSSSNYYYHRMYGDGSSAGIDTNSLNRFFSSQGVTANVFGAHIIDFLDYTNTNKYKVTRILEGYDTNGAGSINFQ